MIPPSVSFSSPSENGVFHSIPTTPGSGNSKFHDEVTVGHAPVGLKQDDVDALRLQQLGYDPVLGRDYTFWSSLAISTINIGCLQVDYLFSSHPWIRSKTKATGSNDRVSFLESTGLIDMEVR